MMVGTLEPKEIDQLLGEQRFARLACYADGKGYVVPMSYVYADGEIYGQTAAGRKIQMMRKNPEVCLEVDDVRSLTDWRSAIVWGRYEELSGLKAADAAGKLLDRFGPIFEESLDESRLGRNIIPERVGEKVAPEVVYVIHITEKSGRFEHADA